MLDPRESINASCKASLRIALATDWFLPRLGGIELHVADLARMLVAAGHHAQVLTSTPGPAVADGVAVERLPSRYLPGFGFSPPFGLVRMIRAALLAGRYDMMHAHLSVVSPVGYAAVLAARSLRLPTVVTFHSVLLRKTHMLRLADHLFGWSRWPLVVAAVSTLVARQLREAVPRLEVAILPNGVDPASWGSSTGADARVGDTIVAVSALRLHRKKRPLVLLAAFRQAQQDAASHGRRLLLHIAGDGPQRARLAHAIARQRLPGVALHGAVSREGLRALYAEADLFVLPSIRESFGLAALEARCAGLAVVAMRAAGSADFLRHGETGLLAADDRALAEHMQRLAVDDALRRRLATPDPALDRYAWPAVIAAHLACYRRARTMAALSPARDAATTAEQEA